MYGGVSEHKADYIHASPVLSCMCARSCGPNCPWPPLTLFNWPLSLLPSSSLSRWIRLLPAATWSSLTEREGIKDSLISTQIKRHFGFHPTRRLACARGTWSLCVFSLSLKADLWWVLGSKLHHRCHFRANMGIGAYMGRGRAGSQGWSHTGPGPVR